VLRTFYNQIFDRPDEFWEIMGRSDCRKWAIYRVDYSESLCLMERQERIFSGSEEEEKLGNVSNPLQTFQLQKSWWSSNMFQRPE